MNALTYIIALLLITIWLIATLVLHLGGMIHLLLVLAFCSLLMRLFYDEESIT